MKKKLIMILTLSLILNIAGATIFFYKYGMKVNQDHIDYEFQPTPYWKNYVSEFKIINKKVAPAGIVFAGDSITEDFLVNEFFPTRYVLNRGIRGDTTEGLNRRFETTVLDAKPSKIFILIGTNDIAYKVNKDKIIKNYTIIIEMALATKTKPEVFVQSILPVGEKENSRENQYIDEINYELKNLTQKYDIPFIDVAQNLKDENGFLNEKFSEDGLHLNGEGFYVWAQIIQDYL